MNKVIKWIPTFFSVLALIFSMLAKNWSAAFPWLVVVMFSFEKAYQE